jgi:hypothetical protein
MQWSRLAGDRVPNALSRMARPHRFQPLDERLCKMRRNSNFRKHPASAMIRLGL